MTVDRVAVHAGGRPAAPPLTADEVLVWRQIAGLTVDGQFATPLIEAWDQFYDSLAGPRRLTDREREIRRACRERFGAFNPDDVAQSVFITELMAVRHLAAVS